MKDKRVSDGPYLFKPGWPWVSELRRDKLAMGGSAENKTNGSAKEGKARPQ